MNNSFLTDDDTRSFCGQCRSRSDCTDLRCQQKLLVTSTIKKRSALDLCWSQFSSFRVFPIFSETTGNLNTILQAKNITEGVKQDKKYCVELSNRTLGIIGLGALGMAVGKRFKDLGVSSILYHDKTEVAMAEVFGAKFVSLEELFETCDILCVCSNVQSTSNTSNTILDKKSFKLMKSSAVLLDATKGLAANFTDMYEALRNGEISAAGLDVREYDVIPNRHPLTALENCFFLPYRECYKWDGRRSLSAELANSVLECLAP